MEPPSFVLKNIVVEHQKICYNLIRAIVLQGGSLPNFKRREVVQMDTYQVLSLLLLGGNFLVALLAYIDRNNKRK